MSHEIFKVIYWGGIFIGIAYWLFYTQLVLWIALAIMAVPTEVWGSMFIVSGYLVIHDAWKQRHR